MKKKWLILLLALSPLAAAARPDKPNIILLLTDDQTYESIGGWNNPEVKTPNLDRLQQAGVTFTHAYNMGSLYEAVCISSRTMLVTGQNLWGAEHWTPAQSKSWPMRMSDAGYRTYYSGKWHVAAIPKIAQHFDVVGQVRPGMAMTTKDVYHRPPVSGEDTWKPWDTSRGGYWKGGKHWSEVLADEAVRFLGQAAKEPQPFFMYLAFNAPHDPRQSPKKYVDMYPLDKVSVPVNFLPQYPGHAKIGLPENLRDEELAPFPRTPHAIQVHRQEYYALITHLDEQIGRILDALKASGKEGDTYVFLTSDHGLACGQHGIMGKQNMFDHSLRVPLFVRGPGLPPGKKLDMQVYLQDVMATSLDLARADSSGIFFRSLMPLVQGRRDRNYDAIFGAYMDLQRMVRNDRYKLICYPALSQYLLFDLEKDPHEMTDLSGHPEQRERMEQMRSELAALEKNMGGSLALPPLPAPAP